MDEIQRYYRIALWLGILTVGYNLVEGVVSILFGIQDETLTLFGFGIDSFIEVLSGVGIVAMLIRIRRNPGTPRSQFERTALRITAGSFFILAVGLAATTLVNVVIGHKPETTLAGMIIALVSIATMTALVAAKRKVGRQLNSAPILADANCTLVCVYMSLVLLASSLIYKLTGFGLADSLGAAGLIYFSVKEGVESLNKARDLDCGCEGEE